MILPTNAGGRPFSSRPGSSGSGGYRDFMAECKALSADDIATDRGLLSGHGDRRVPPVGSDAAVFGGLSSTNNCDLGNCLTLSGCRCLCGAILREGELMPIAFVFPGQGSQAVGMGLALANAFPVARHTFEEIDAALGDKLTRVMWEGPAESLTLTQNAQPALLAVSIAALRVLQAEAGLDLARDAAFVAGHSLGEYSALAGAGAFTLADAARLVRLRGQAMQKAVPVGAGAMAALLGLEFEPAVAIAREAAAGQICQ